MYFKKIYMHGFKSFAEPVTIEFNKGITCIVGPNGSGKSNISDAIRWVLGEQSPKNLRGSKMDEVIFAGTESRKSRGMAEVTLTIDNSTGILPIDYNEVAITRRMFRSGESEYAINDNQCRLRDIREMVMDTGIGVDGYSIIGQGKIADLVSGKPESRREIFEEAAGVVTYRNKKNEAERKLNSTMNNLERINDIIGEIEERIDGLKTDSEKASEYIELRDRNKELEINITLKSIDGINEKNDALQEDLEGILKSTESVRAKKESVENQISEGTQKTENLESLASDARNKLMGVIDEINLLVNKQEVDAQKLSAIKENTDRLLNEITEIDEKLKTERHNLDELYESRKELEEEHNKLKEKLTGKVNEYNGALDELNGIALSIDDKRNEIIRIGNEIGDKRAERSGLVSMQDTLDRRRADLESDSAIDGEQEQMEEVLRNMEGQEASLTETMESLRKDAVTTAAKHETLADREKALDKKTMDLHISVGQTCSRMKAMEEMEANYEGYGYAVKYMMRNKGRGICGVVADIISVPEGYEVAIETALGGSMQNIICETDSDAKAAIRELKVNKVGRLTFLPLESMRPAKSGSAAQLKGQPGFMGVGTDCVDFDSKFRPAIEYLLNRVVLVDNMDNAIKMSKQGSNGLRFVTLDGEVINTVGAITGGKYKNKTANLLERKSEIASLKDRETKLKREETNAQEELDSVRNQIEKILGEIEAINKKYREAELVKVSKQNEIKNQQQLLDAHRENSDKRKSELTRIEDEKKSSGVMVSELDTAIAQLEERSKNISDEIEKELDIHARKKSALDKISEDITSARVDVTSCDSKKSNIDTIASRIDDTIAQLTSQREAKDEQVKLYEEESRKLTEGDGNPADAVIEKTGQKEELEAYISESEAEKARIYDSMKTLLDEQKRLDEESTALSDSKYNIDIKKAKFETQLENFKNKLWDDFEISYVQAMDFRAEDFKMTPAVKESREIKARIRELGEVNIGAIEEYKKVSERYEFLTGQRQDVLDSMDALTAIVTEMDSIINKKFTANFNAVGKNFQDVFVDLFGGGKAELKLDDTENPLDAGIVIEVQPPGKILKNITLFSGGEQTMMAIALMFAILKVHPTPFCILDEVEAALDDANIEKFADYLRTFSDIQFALITHQKETMEHADVLYGVTMPERGISKLLSLKLGDRFELESPKK